jgi:hypothetical protein
VPYAAGRKNLATAGSQRRGIASPGTWVKYGPGQAARASRVVAGIARRPDSPKIWDSPAAFLESWRGHARGKGQPPGISSSSGSGFRAGSPFAASRTIAMISCVISPRARAPSGSDEVVRQSLGLPRLWNTNAAELGHGSTTAPLTPSTERCARDTRYPRPLS